MTLPPDPDWPVVLRTPGPARDSALRELAGRLRRHLQTALRGRAGVGEADCEDFSQDALVRILDRLDQFQGRSRFETWACTIAINAAFTRLRRRHWRDISLDALSAGARALPEALAVAPEVAGSDGARTAVLAALRRAIAENLTDRQRTGVCAELGGLPFDQIAALLGANRNATYKLLHDARCALKRHLLAEGVGPEEIRHAFAP